MNPSHVLTLPGWQGSGPDHWQSRWERTYGYQRVEQHDWQRPLRGDWIARLEDVLLSCSEPVVLVAHSLGCMAAVAWASHSKNLARVKAALLVAPPDIARDDMRQILPSWTPQPLLKLPFKTVLLASGNDAFCSLERARAMALAWGSEFHDVGERGHLNAESSLADWPDAHAELARLVAIENKQ